tara:strand:+ start:271 stop:468 length:198 start_codon:yes stop_codon:yes gene_type:complete
MYTHKKERQVLKGNGWDNHEDTFEEALRRELLAAQQIILLLKEDLKQMTKAYYTVIEKKEKQRLN